MPRLADLRQLSRQSSFSFESRSDTHAEDLVHDARAFMSPTQVVEQKLLRALHVGEGVDAISPSEPWRRTPR